MKNLLIFIVISAALMSCNSQRDYAVQPQMQVAQQQYIDPNTGYDVLQQGGQQVAYVHSSTGDFFMDYLLFNQLMGSGGWGSVYGRYYSNPGMYYNPGLVNRYHSYSSAGSYGYNRSKSTTSYWNSNANSRTYHPSTTRTANNPGATPRTLTPNNQSRTYTPSTTRSNTSASTPNVSNTPSRTYTPSPRASTSSYTPSRSSSSGGSSYHSSGSRGRH